MKEFVAEIKNLHNMLNYISDEASKIGFKSSDIVRLQLASEEALTNVIKYAYSETLGNLEIDCGREGDSCFFYILIKDRGLPFNPLEEVEDVDIMSGSEQRRIGGLGVLMMKIIMDNLTYQREGDVNILIMKKKISDSVNP